MSDPTSAANTHSEQASAVPHPGSIGRMCLPNRTSPLVLYTHLARPDRFHVIESDGRRYLEVETYSRTTSGAFILMTSRGGYRVSSVRYSIVTAIGPIPQVFARQMDDDTVAKISHDFFLGSLPYWTDDKMFKYGHEGLLQASMIDDQPDEEGNPLYTHVTRCEVDLTTGLGAGPGSEPNHDSQRVPLSITFRMHPLLSTLRPMLADDLPWMAWFPDGSLSERRSLGSAILEALKSSWTSLIQQNSVWRREYRGTVSAVVDDVRPPHVKPNRGRGHAATMDVSLLIAPHAGCEHQAFDHLSRMILDEQTALQIAGILRTREGFSFYRDQQSLVLGPALSDTAYGCNQWFTKTVVIDPTQLEAAAPTFEMKLSLSCRPATTEAHVQASSQ